MYDMYFHFDTMFDDFVFDILLKHQNTLYSLFENETVHFSHFPVIDDQL